MSNDTSGWAVLTGLAVTATLTISGFAMVSDPPSDADSAVGKGLLVLAICAGLVSLLLLSYAVSSSQPERTDWRDRSA